MSADPLQVLVGDGDQARRLEIDGRPGWTLRKLVEAGERGITAAELPAGLRLSDYIFKLKKLHGLSIETIRAPNSGPLGGSHGRYRLVSRVQILDQEAI